MVSDRAHLQVFANAHLSKDCVLLSYLRSLSNDASWLSDLSKYLQHVQVCFLGPFERFVLIRDCDLVSISQCWLLCDIDLII